MDTVQTTVTSKDGTTIAFDQSGQGPALILVGGALEQRALDTDTAKLAAFLLLTQHFTVIHYDRRGRGGSTDTLPYALEREIEDIEALIDATGGSAFLSGISSGAALAFEAALALNGKVKKLAMYEAPYNDDQTARQTWRTYRKELNEILAEGRKDDAVIRFMMLVGMPAEHVPEVKKFPMWPLFEAVGHTLAYDAAAMGEESSIPTERAARLTIPALIMDGGQSYPFMHTAAVALAKAMPHAQHRTLEGQTHEVTPEALAPALIEFFESTPSHPTIAN
jgi:pimeloyl-ACP methyl ester carboxylesterase